MLIQGGPAEISTEQGSRTYLIDLDPERKISEVGVTGHRASACASGALLYFATVSRRVLL